MLNTTGNGNRGLGTVVFSWFVTLLNHDFVCAGNSFLCGTDDSGAGGGLSEDGGPSDHNQ